MRKVIIYLPDKLYNTLVRMSDGKPLSQTIRRLLDYITKIPG